MRIITIKNNYDVIPDLKGTILKTKELDSFIIFDNGETCWINNTAFKGINP